MAIVNDITNVDLKITGNMSPYGSSSTGGTVQRVAGTKDWTVSMTQNAYGAGPTITTGATGTFKLMLLSTTNYFSGTALVESIDVVSDIGTGSPVQYTYNIGATGDLSWTGTGSGKLLAKNCTVDWT